MTKSSVNFKAVKSAGHAVSHASREVAPNYLLPSDKSIGTMVLLDDMGKVSATLEAKLALASRQALREKNYSPVWEGVINLRRPKPSEDAKSYRADCSKVVTDWYKRYETSTGHKVLRVDVHLDEGHMVQGQAVLNAHAHVIADRTNDLGRVIQLSPKQLRELQTLTAEVTGLERGKSSFETGRKHIEHQAYKYLAEHGRLETQKQLNNLTVKTDDREKYLLGRNEKIKVALVNQIAAEEAKDKEIAALKKAHEAALAEAGKVPALVTKLDGEPARLAAALKAQEAQLNEGYRLDRERMKQENADALAAGLAKMYSQKDYQALKKDHETELDTLAQAHAEQVLKLEAKLAEAKTEAAKLEAGAVQAQAEINRLVPLAAQVPDLKKALTAAQENAGEVPDLKEQITILKTKIEGEPGRQKAALNDLNVKALEVINPLRKQVKKLEAQLAAVNLVEPTPEPVAKVEAHPPAPSTRGGETAVVVPSGRKPDSRPHGAAPHTPSDHASASDIQRLRQSLKTPPVPTPQVQPEAPKKPTLMELVKASIEGFMQWLKGRGLNEKLVEPPENGACFGPVVDIDNVHAFQKTGRGAYTHHRLDSLSHVPELNNPKTEIRYRGGLGEIHGQGPERPRQRGG